jgi:hypothetical protein
MAFYLESANFEVHKLSKASESFIVRGQSTTPMPPKNPKKKFWSAPLQLTNMKHNPNEP